MTPLAFLDTETTSLARPFSPAPGEVWEVGVIVRAEGDLGPYVAERSWLLPVTLDHADPESLKISRFHERHPAGDRYRGSDALVTPLPRFVGEFIEIVDGCHLVGNVVSFDEERLAAILIAHGITEMPWHYHLVDVESMAAGHLARSAQVEWHFAEEADDMHGLAEAKKLLGVAQPRWDSEELSAALGIHVPEDDRHTALGDARWAMATYDAVMGGR